MNSKTKSPLFIHSILDEAGLNVYEFRVLSHVARRQNCYASVPKIAQMCRMGQRKVQTSLKSLTEKGLLAKKSRNGQTTIYRLSSNISDCLEILRMHNLESQKPKSGTQDRNRSGGFAELDPSELFRKLKGEEMEEVEF